VNLDQTRLSTIDKKTKAATVNEPLARRWWRMHDTGTRPVILQPAMLPAARITVRELNCGRGRMIRLRYGCLHKAACCDEKFSMRVRTLGFAKMKGLDLLPCCEGKKWHARWVSMKNREIRPIRWEPTREAEFISPPHPVLLVVASGTIMTTESGFLEISRCVPSTVYVVT
jgi:hypothetical protein